MACGLRRVRLCYKKMARRRSRRFSRPLVPGFWTLLAAALIIAGTLGWMWLGGKLLVVKPEAVGKVLK